MTQPRLVARRFESLLCRGLLVFVWQTEGGGVVCKRFAWDEVVVEPDPLR